jgi:ferric-dicitrate binding protein FerR (iron transport regulator)
MTLLTLLQKYFDAYMEGDLRAEDQAALGDWLQADVSHVDSFVRESFLHWQLFSISAQKSLHDDVMAAAPPADASSIARALEPALNAAPDGRFRRWRGTFAVAAALAVVSGALWGFVQLKPRMVAQLSNASVDVQWSAGGAAPAVGTLLRTGQSLLLAQGRVMATLVSGAHIIVDGPAEIRLEGVNRIWLESGRIGVAVPVQATGLIVDCAIGQFVDLGTDFTINLDPNAGCELHVFSGMVELTPHGAEDRPVSVSMGSAITCDRQSGDVEFVPYDEGQQLGL